MDKISITTLRNNLYKIIDNIIETGAPLEIDRHGHIIKIILVENKKNKLDNLVKHNAINCEPDELINIKVGSWQADQNI